ncbi:MAG TPA: hypothetical protein EYP85_07045 [Armatimonadetes bacterium]|nr:hypothetical protein [Armatimonadota bacterium]
MNLVGTLTPLEVWVVALGLVVIYTDWRYHKIYNWATFPSILGGWGLQLWLWREGGKLVRHGLAGFAVGIALTIVPFALGLLYAGDVKYLAAVGALTNPGFVVWTVLYGGVCHGILSLILLRREQLLIAFKNIGRFFYRRAILQMPVDFQAESEGTLPYGISLALGSFLTLGFRLYYGAYFPLWAN